MSTSEQDSGQDDLGWANGILQDLWKRLTDDPAAAFETDTLRALAILKTTDLAQWTRRKTMLRKAHVSLRDVQEAMPTLKARRGADADDQPEPRRVGESIPDAPLPILIIPHPYSVSVGMTAVAETDGEGHAKLRSIAPAPVLITGRLQDVDDGAISLRLAWRFYDGWRERTVDRGIIASARQILTLANDDFPVFDGNTRALTTYLARLEAANRSILPTGRVASRLGWLEGGQHGFLWGRHSIPPNGGAPVVADVQGMPSRRWPKETVAFRGRSDGDEALAAGFRAQGTFEGWAQAVSAVQEHPRVLLALYAAFVPPLLEILGVPNFIIDWANRTSTGKTTTLRLAASVWGIPDELREESIIGSWDATRVFVERAGALLNGLPLILDDTKRARNPRAVAEALYTVANGRGRGRGNVQNLARTRSFRTVLFSTGEAPATSFTQDGGTRTRCVEIRGVPFGATDAGTADLVTQLNAGLMQNHGYAGPRFVRWLLQNRKKWESFGAWYRQTVAHYRSTRSTPEAARLSSYAAAIACAGQLAHRALPLPWKFGDPLSTLWEPILAEGSDAAGDLRALQDVVSWAYSNETTFRGRQVMDQFGNPRNAGAVSGRWDAKADWKWIAFFPNVLTDVLRRAGYEPEAILPIWRERGWLLTDQDRGRYEKRVRVNCDKPWMNVISREAIDSFQEGANSGNACGDGESYNSGTD